MVTVLFLGAAMTAIVSGAAFVTLKELNSGNKDQLGASALSVAEAGVDRFAQAINSGVWTFNNLNTAGCANPANPAVTLPPLSLTDGSIGGGTYHAELTVYDPAATTVANRLPPTACAPGGVPRPTSLNKFKPFFQITSSGTFNGSTRVIRQIVSLQVKGLPIGLFGDSFDVNGNPSVVGASLIAKTNVSNRDKFTFVGLDPWYLYKDFFPGGVTGPALTSAVPAAAHAAGSLGTVTSPNPNCSANKKDVTTPADNKGQSLWDSDGSASSGNVTGTCNNPALLWPNGSHPGTNKFTSADLSRFKTSLNDEDYAALKAAAQSSGLYCSYQGVGGSGGTTCTRQGTDLGRDYNSSDVCCGATSIIGSGTKNFVAFMEYRSGTATQNTHDWNGGNVGPCNDDPNLNQSMVLIVKNGGFGQFNAGDFINGAIIVDGDVGKVNGHASVNGTVMGGGVVVRGTFDFTLDACWVRNMPGPFFNVIRGQWAEVDR
jgi:hypothetical protein